MYSVRCGAFLSVRGTTWGGNMMEDGGGHQMRDEARELAKTEH